MIPEVLPDVFDLDGCLRWYVLRVLPSTESAVAARLKDRSISAFAPMYASQRAWSGKTKTIQMPLFAGCVFCLLAPSAHREVLPIANVLGFVQDGSRPALVDHGELENLWLLAHSGYALQPWPFVNHGPRVRVHNGAFAGVEGILVQARTLAVSVSVLQCSVAVALDNSVRVAAKAKTGS
jgi:transcription antitermination factor NusG